VTTIAPATRARKLMRELENRRAKNSLAVYAGLQIPSKIECDDPADLIGLEKLPIAARYIPAEHHRLLIDKLEGIERGYIVADRRTNVCGTWYARGEHIPFKRLMVFMPPGSAKSTYGSVLFPSWYLGKNPATA
jgi:hypothetical protein